MIEAKRKDIQKSRHGIVEFELFEASVKVAAAAAPSAHFVPASSLSQMRPPLPPWERNEP